MGTDVASFPDAFDQVGYIKKKKKDFKREKSGLTNATKRGKKKSVCPLILAEIWSTDYGGGGAGY